MTVHVKFSMLATLFITLTFLTLSHAQEPNGASDYTLYWARCVSSNSRDRVPSSQAEKPEWPLRFYSLRLADAVKSPVTKARFLPLTSLEVAKRWGSVSQLEPLTSNDLPVDIKSTFGARPHRDTFHVYGVAAYKRDKSYVMTFTSGEGSIFRPYYSRFTLLPIGTEAKPKEIQFPRIVPKTFSGFVNDERRLGYFAFPSSSPWDRRAGEVRALNRDGSIETLGHVEADIIRASPIETTVALIARKAPAESSLFVKDQELKKHLWKNSVPLKQDHRDYGELDLLWSEDGERVCLCELVVEHKRPHGKIVLTVFDANNGNQLQELELPREVDAYVLMKSQDETAAAALLGLELRGAKSDVKP